MMNRTEKVTIIIPAWNESARLSATLRQLRLTQFEGTNRVWDELIVVDDGSSDDTCEQAMQWADRVIVHPRNKGKGAALTEGWKRAQNGIVVFLDADLGESARYVGQLLPPLQEGAADMVIAKLPRPQTKGGWGLVRRIARFGIHRLSGYTTDSPLSGQRAMRREVLEAAGNLADRFGIEVGLTIDAVRGGFRVMELEMPFRHRETGRDWTGILHRGKQFVQISRTLLAKWRST